MQKACQLSAKILDEACKLVKAGITSNEIDVLVH